MLRDRFLMAKGRELFRPYNGTGPEYRAFTYLPSITHLCRRAIFAGAPPSMFATWFKGTSEAHLIDRCLSNLNCKPSDWDLTKHYFCFNEKDANPELLRRDLRTLIDSPVRLKAIVFNLQDRLLDKSGVSSLQEIMLTYVREVALLYLRRIAAQPKTAVVITADHGFTRYDKKYVIDDLNVKGGGKQVNIHNRCLEYLSTAYTTKGPATSARITSPAAFGLPPTWTAADLALGQDSYGWPSPSSSSAHNPYQVNGHDHGGLTPEETVVPVAVYVTRS
jgi:hypothetical protein